MNPPLICRRKYVQKKQCATSLNLGFVTLLLAVFSLVRVPSSHAADYYWDADGTGTGLGGTGNWDLSSSLWRFGSPAGSLRTWSNTESNNDVYLTGTVGTLTLTSGISVNDISVNPTIPGTYTIASATGQVLTLDGSSASALSIATGSTLTISTSLAGTTGFTKSGEGNLLLSSTSNSLTGGILVSGGSLRAPGAAASSVLRNNELTLASGTTLVRSDSSNATDFRLGALSGSGTFNAGTNGATLLVLSNQTFSGAVLSTGLTIRGAATEILAGTTSQLTGTISVGSCGGLAFSGTAAASGVNAISLTDRGVLSLDNSTTNSSDRLTMCAVNAAGGTLMFVGNGAGSSEAIGDVTFGNGQTTIKVQHNAGTSGATVLTLNSITRGNSGVAVNFASSGTGLVASGNGARIAITGPVTMVNNVIGTSTVPGYAAVDGKDFASYSGSGASGGVIKVASTQVSGAISSSTNVALVGNGTASGPLSFNTIKIRPSTSGQSLALGSNTLSTYGILLDGSAGQDFSVTGGSIGGASARYFHVWDSARTLFIGSNLAGANQPIVKAGDGFVALTGTSDQANFNSLGNIYLTGGTFRVSPGLNFGSQNIVYFRGGVLEIANGTTLNRLASGVTGGIGFDGSGGFSAYGSNAAVNLGSGTELSWGSTNFLKDGDALLFGSTQSNGRLTFQNPINLSGVGYNAREFRVYDNLDSANDIAVLSGVLSGPMLTDFLKTGEGTLELSAANVFAGNVIVQQGTLAVSGGSALPDGGTIMFANAPGVTLQLKANETVGALSGGGSLGGSVNLQANTLTLGDQRDSTFAGLVNGAGGKLIKQGAGVLTLTAANSYTGGTTINGGAVRFGADNALPVGSSPGSSYGLTLGGGTLLLNGYTLGSQSGSGAVTQSAGTLTLTANSTLEMVPNDPSQLIVFNGFAPGASMLTITGWSGSLATDSIVGGQLLFAAGSWNPSYLSSIVFADFNGGLLPAGAHPFQGDLNFYSITPVPEPSTAWASGLLLAGAVARVLWRARS